jgi:V8-like Glu-specific endopeptidase
MTMAPKRLTSLRRLLAELYPREAEQRRVVSDAGLRAASVSFDPTAATSWFNILEEASRQQRVNEVVSVVLEEYPGNELLRQFVEETFMLLGDSEQREIEQGAREGGLLASQAGVDTLAGLSTATARAERKSHPTPPVQFHHDLELLAKSTRSPENEEALRKWLTEAARLSVEPGRRRFDALLGRRFGLGASRILPSRAVELPQRIVFRDKTVSVRFLEDGMKAGLSVACLAVPVFENGRREGSAFGYGTGWLIAPDHVVTCLHVMHARAASAKARQSDLDLQARAARAHFEWQSSSVHDQGVAVREMVASDEQLDVAVLRLERDVSNAAPLMCNIKRLEKPKDDVSFVVNIIQHPRGEDKRVGLRANAVLDVTERDLFYFTDTDEGSSGAPVLDDDWTVLAVHRAVQYRQDVAYMGRSIGYANVGTRATTVLAWLKTAAPTLYASIRLAAVDDKRPERS